jgi:hypothetical protein
MSQRPKTGRFLWPEIRQDRVKRPIQAESVLDQGRLRVDGRLAGCSDRDSLRLSQAPAIGADAPIRGAPELDVLPRAGGAGSSSAATGKVRPEAIADATRGEAQRR